MSFLLYTVDVLFIVVSILLVLIVLIQKGRGGGLASAFGGVGGHTAFGSKTGDVLTWATAVVFGVMLLLAIGANLVFNQVGHQTIIAAPMSETADGFTPPGAPGSSLPQAPVTADPGVANPPPGPPADGPKTPATPEISAPGPSTQP